MGRYLPIIIVALLTIYCVVEVAQAAAVRGAPDASLAVGHRRHLRSALRCCGWLFFGRPNAGSLGTRKRSTPNAPDDDVDFLRGL